MAMGQLQRLTTTELQFLSATQYDSLSESVVVHEIERYQFPILQSRCLLRLTVVIRTRLLYPIVGVLSVADALLGISVGNGVQSI